VIYSGGNSKRNGVGAILDLERKSAAADVIRHSDRLMLVTMVIHGEEFNIVSAYAPQTGLAQEEKDTLFEI
jgi:hypothetical protein